MWRGGVVCELAARMKKEDWYVAREDKDGGGSRWAESTISEWSVVGDAIVSMLSPGSRAATAWVSELLPSMTTKVYSSVSSLYLSIPGVIGALILIHLFKSLGSLSLSSVEEAGSSFARWFLVAVACFETVGTDWLLSGAVFALTAGELCGIFLTSSCHLLYLSSILFLTESEGNLSMAGFVLPLISKRMALPSCPVTR